MATAKKKKPPIEYVPYRNNPHVYVYYELEFGKDVIKPGDKIKIKFDRDTYTFLRLAHHSKHDTTWVDCISLKKGSWHSFRVEDVQRVIRPKRSRRKKIGN
jgi:hypothetical protein